MKPYRNALLGLILALTGLGTATPARAFEWPSGMWNRRCDRCGQRRMIFTVHAPDCPQAAVPYYAPQAAPGLMGGAPAYAGDLAGVPPGQPGQPQPEGPSTAPGTSPAGPDGGLTAPGAGTPEAAAANAADAAGAGAGAAPPATAAGLGGGVGTPQGALNMFGDVSPFAPALNHIRQTNGFRPPVAPVPPGGNVLSPGARASVPVPNVRSFKISDNQTPMPVDRITFSFDHFDYLNQSVNQRFGIPLSRIQAYRYIFGFEKTLLDGRASFGLRMPLNNVTGNSNVPGFGRSSTSVGDLSAYLKYALYLDREKGRVFTTGLAITMPTGPTSFAGANYLKGIHQTDLQPFLAFQYQWDRAYVIGFSSINVPTSPRDVLTYYNDLSVGYYVYRSADPTRFLRAIAPTFEVHSNTPLNHRDVFNYRDIAGTAQVVDLTEGVNFFLGQRAVFSVGVGEPVTGPRPFSLEALALLNIFF